MSIINRIRTNILVAQYMRDTKSASARVAGDNLNNKGDTASEDINATTQNADTTAAKKEDIKKTDIKKTEKSSESISDEKDSKDATSTVEAQPIGEADMTGGGHIKDNDPSVIDLGFGVQIDTGKMRTPTVTHEAFEAASNSGIPSSNLYLDYLAQQQAAANLQGQQIHTPYAHQEGTPIQTAPPTVPQPGQGRHKVDNPEKPKPTIKKAEEDDVTVDLDGINIETNPPKPARAMPEIVTTNIPQADPIEVEPAIPVFDNSAVTSVKNCRYLKDIERTALECGKQIQMIPRMGSNGTPSGLISCIVYSPESPEPSPQKCFTIDTGVIIDRRAKIFPGIIDVGFEDVPAYPILIPKNDDKQDKSKSKNVFNEQMFKDIFIGGIDMLRPERSLYTPAYMKLNQNVALITMPTNNMNKETRKMVQNRLMDAMEAGVFDEVRKVDSYSRFRFANYCKEDMSFVLSNAGVPYRFCGPCMNSKEIEIHFDANKTVRIYTVIHDADKDLRVPLS